MGIRILQGRELRTDDRGRGVVVSDELARRYWRGRSPVGELVTYGDSTREIVGVVSSARDVMLDGAPMPTLYHVWDDRDAPIATVVARTIGAPQRAIPQIRRAVREVDGRAAITMLATLDELLDRSVAERHFNTLLFGVFAVAALALGLVGIYGLVAVLVSRREREMGIRLALGATGTEVLLFVMSGTLRWVAAGLLAGLVVAWRQAGYVRPFVFGITETDPLTLGLVSAGFLLVAAAATYVPARRAARVDPVVALRAE
jgi:hypothetical protein